MPRHASLESDFATEAESATMDNRTGDNRTGDNRTGAQTPDGRPEVRDDYFVARDGLVFAGSHLLIDFWGAGGLQDSALIETALREAVAACDATLLHVHLHRFTANGGISGVAVLAESHISIHTWPERGFAAFDIFMCGNCDPYKAIPVLRRHFEPETVQLSETKRGLVG